MSSQDDIPTPRVPTGSWAVSIGRCQAYIIRLERAAVEHRAQAGASKLIRGHNSALYHIDVAQRCDSLVSGLRTLIIKYEAWPNLPAEERERKGPALDILIRGFERDTEEICQALGPGF